MLVYDLFIDTLGNLDVVSLDVVPEVTEHHTKFDLKIVIPEVPYVIGSGIINESIIKLSLIKTSLRFSNTLTLEVIDQLITSFIDELKQMVWGIKARFYCCGFDYSNIVTKYKNKEIKVDVNK